MSDTNSQTVSYVRETMLPESAPPVAEAGAVKWLRANLFSSWLNVILTVLALYAIYAVLALVLPWAFGGVWNAGSLTECREALFAVYKSSHGGACWAVIEDRWLQIMFGFYPPELFWRPILAFVLLFVALAPILFAEKVPGQLMWFTLAYPFIATWLIWGGSFWVPVFAAMGFVVGAIALKVLGRFAGPIVANLGAIAAALIWWGAIMGPVDDGLSRMIGSGRFDATVASLEEQSERLPREVAEMETQAEAKAEEIAQAVEVKNEILQSMVVIRIEEFAVEEQFEAKEDAFQVLEAAEESLENLQDLLADWGGVPAAASDASEADISEAEAAATQATDLMEDVAGFLTDAIGDIDGTDEPADVASLLAVAAEKDASILEDAGALVAKATLIDPLTELQARASGFTSSSSADEIATLRADISTVIASLGADVDTLHGIQDKVIASNTDELKAPQAALDSQRQVLAALRDEATVIAQDTFRVSSAESNGRGYLNSLNSLEERETSLPDLRAETDALRAALPSAHRGMIAVAQLPEGSTSEEQDALNTYLDSQRLVLSTEASIDVTYAELGRVGLRPIDSRQIGGFMLALIIGIAGIVLSLPLGILLALGRQSHLFIVNKICVTFIEVIRGVPLIVWLFTGSLLLNYFLPPGTNFDLLLRVIIMVTLFSAAYIAEVIRGGLAALPTGQYEGGDSLGLSYWQSMQLIVLPQAMKISIPGIVNTFIGLFKDTVLVVFIGLSDPIGFSNLIRADTDWNGVYWELFAFIGLLFFIFCFSMGRYSLYLEKKLQREHR